MSVQGLACIHKTSITTHLIQMYSLLELPATFFWFQSFQRTLTHLPILKSIKKSIFLNNLSLSLIFNHSQSLNELPLFRLRVANVNAFFLSTKFILKFLKNKFTKYPTTTTNSNL